MDSPLFVIGLLVTLGGIIALSILSGVKGRSGEAKNSTPVVTGVIIGTLVGGSSTVGTAQLAYTYGMSAWWFTLGGGIACIILALIYAKPLRRSGCPTLTGMVRKEFGATAGMLASVLSSVGTFINIIAQLISATAVLAVIFPALGLVPALIISAAFMALYVIFGGTKSAGTAGIIKTVLIYAAMIACGAIVLSVTGGLSGFASMVRGIDNSEGVNFFSLFARGVGKDGGACLSLILGVLTTQTYAQGVLSGKTDAAGRNGALISAFLMPPIGIGGILVGLYMRSNAALYAGLTPKTALTAFVMTHVPALPAGMILGALFVTVIGTGAGLSLGVSSIISNDIVKRLTRRFDSPKSSSLTSKIWIAAILALACCLSAGGLGDTILKFAFMSMALRGAVIFVPLLCALWLPGKVNGKFAVASIVISPALVLVFGILNVLPFDPLFIGVLASVIIMGLGLRLRPRCLE